MDNPKEKWLSWAMEIQSIAQAGLAFGSDKYDIDRYEKLRNIAIDIISNYSDIEHIKVRDLFASETGYQTPKVDIRSAAFRHGKILMVREKEDGLWSLPGGWADVGTSAAESAIRECREEAGAIVVPNKLIAVHHANKRNNRLFPYTVYKFFIGCELKEMNFTENTETLQADFFGSDKLPPLSVNRNTAEQIALCFEALNDENFVTIFD